MWRAAVAFLFLTASPAVAWEPDFFRAADGPNDEIAAEVRVLIPYVAHADSGDLIERDKAARLAALAGCETEGAMAVESRHPAYEEVIVLCGEKDFRRVMLMRSGTYAWKAASFTLEDIAKRMVEAEEAKKSEEFGRMLTSDQFIEIAFHDEMIVIDESDMPLARLVDEIKGAIRSVGYECFYVGALKGVGTTHHGVSIQALCGSAWFTVSMNSEKRIFVFPGRIDP